jgi:hypothetical protein
VALAIAACGESARDSALPLARTPANALATCLKITIMHDVCPRRVPLLRGRPAAVQAGCLGANGALVSITSKRCRTALWSLMGAPPRPAVTGHIVISASLDDWQCSSAHEVRASAPGDDLLNPNRKRAVSLGWLQWYGHSGELVLAPPYFAGGGPVGNHLEFCFRANSVNYAITLHSWPPLAQVVATLKSLVASALQK